MPERRRYIKDIGELVEKKLKELNLEATLELDQFIKKNKRFYSVPCLNKKGEKVFLKILIANELAPSEAIRREIKIRKFLMSFKEKINYPPLIQYDNQNFPYWFISQYLEGSLIGHFYEIYLNKKKYIPLLIDTLFALCEIPEDSIKKIFQIKDFYLWKRSYPQYFQMVKSYEKGIENKIAEKIDFQKIYQLLNNKRKILEESPLVLAHGDFTLANFVISQEKLIITDWEQAHLDNFVYDFSHLWIQLWRYPHWQKNLISQFLSRLSQEKKRVFQDLFGVIIITEALGELRWSINLCKKEYRAGAIRTAQKTIKEALRGFNYLSESI